MKKTSQVSPTTSTEAGKNPEVGIDDAPPPRGGGFDGVSSKVLVCTLVLTLMAIHATHAATLVHRYSFSDADGSTTFADSVGGANWDGTLPDGGSFDGQQLSLVAVDEEYGQLPAGILSNYTAVTIDAWATFPSELPNGFLWAMGNTDSGGFGEDYLLFEPSVSRVTISGADPGYAAEQNATADNLSLQTVHVTCVINPALRYMDLYTNGVLAGENDAVTTPLSAVVDTFNYIGRSLYNGDPFIDVDINEFRIWNGALNPLEVAGCDVAGPDTVGTAADAGTVTSLVLTVQHSQLNAGVSEAVEVFASLSAVNYPIEIERLCTFSSGDTNILAVSSGGVITAIATGATTITAAYEAVSNSVTITVAGPVPPSQLVHRYSFSDADGSTTFADSVGGANWDGTLPDGGSFDGQQLLLVAADEQYGQLPAGILSNYTAVTIDAWATFPSELPNGFLWAMGNTDSGGAGEDYLLFEPSVSRVTISGADPGYAAEQNATADNLSLQTVHVTCVINPALGYMDLYTNGVLAGENDAVTTPLSAVVDTFNYIGRSLYNGDPFIDVDINEFRIYNGALTAAQVQQSDTLGPDQLLPLGVTTKDPDLLVIEAEDYFTNFPSVNPPDDGATYGSTITADETTAGTSLPDPNTGLEDVHEWVFGSATVTQWWSINYGDYPSVVAAGTNSTQWAVNILGYSGTGYITALPNVNANVNFTIYATATGTNNEPPFNLPVASACGTAYNVYFADTNCNSPGGQIYYIWARGWGDSSLGGGNNQNKSCNFGLDWVPQSTSVRMGGAGTNQFVPNQWVWDNISANTGAPDYVVVTNAGWHVVNFWMREDGFVLDKFLLTTNAAYSPYGIGPAENFGSPPIVLSIAKVPGGVQISWTGTGTLQSSSKVTGPYGNVNGGGTSPVTVTPPAGIQMYYRVIN